MSGTIGARLAEHAKHKPDSVFCTFIARGEAETLTFGQLYRRSAAYAARYRREGVAPGDLIVIVLQHTPHLFYSYLGAILAGATPTFMPFPSPKQRADLYWADHEALFARIQPRLLVTYQENLSAAREQLSTFALPTLIADDAILEEEPAALHEARPDDVACLQHSSGTTSLKKGVMLTHRAILDEVGVYANAIAFTDRDSIASWLPLYHDMGFIACFMSSVVLGTHLVALDPFEWTMRPTTLFDAIERYGTTFTWMPNFAFSHLVNAARKDARWNLSGVRAFINCSEPCKAATFARFAERFASSGVTPSMLQVCYAMAENVFAVTQTPIGKPPHTAPDPGFADGVVSCGTPVDGVELDIRAGEICIRSPFLFEGYYKLPDVTHRKLRAGWYHSGDLGFVRDGELYVTGRMDDMLIVAGRNYFAHEIEAVVNDVPGVLPGRNVAIGVEDRRTDATVVVVLVECTESTEGEELSALVRAAILERVGLAVHEVLPLSRGQMVKTTSGKISRVKNRELYLAGMLSVGKGAGR